MAIDKLLEHQDEIKSALLSKKQRRHFDLCSDRLILLFVSMAYNAAKGFLSLNDKERKKLSKYRKLFLELGYSNATIGEKRKLLNKNCKYSIEGIKALYGIILNKISQNLLK